MILEHYVALNKGVHIENTVYLKELNRVNKHIRKKFKNPIICKVEKSNEKDFINWLWQALEYCVTDEESVVEIYSCYKNEQEDDIREAIVLNKGDNKPSLEHGRYIVYGNFILGEILQREKAFSVEDSRIHILSVYKNNKNLYMDIIIESYEKLEINDCTKCDTRREKVLRRIEYNQEFLRNSNKYNIELCIEPVEEIGGISFNDMKIRSYSIDYIPHYKDDYKNHDFYKNMLFKYYYNRNRIPEKFINKDSIICRVEMEGAEINEPLETIELKLRDKIIEYPIEDSFSLKLGELEEGQFIEYLSPIDNKKHKVFIDSVELYDPYENIPQERIEQMKDYVSEGTRFLLITYENPDENINMRFYLKSFLDLPVEKNTGSSMMWLFPSSKENGKNGYKVSTDILDENVIEIPEGEIEIELVYITQRLDSDTINFSLSENFISSLDDYKIGEKIDMDIWSSIEGDYKCIRFTPEPITYCSKACIISESDKEYKEVNIPLGKSRIGGPVVDLPTYITYPEELFFAAQINLKEFQGCFFNNYLPKEGFLYVFTDEDCETGRVIYSNSKAENLKRVIKEHDKCFYSGNLINDIYIEEENIRERYDEEWAQEGEKIGWNPFIGTEKSKLFGIYTNCQCEEDELKEELLEDKVVLLQIGEDFTEAGVFSVRVEKSDLERMDFSSCTFEWSQS